MKLIVNKNHELEGCSCLLGVDSENKSEQLIITVFDELIDKWAYLEFKTANGTKYTSERLNIVNKQITYTLPNGLLQNGYLVVQAVFRDANNYVWKSLTRQLKVAAAINAEATLPTEYPSFIADAQEILDAAQAAAQSIGGVVAGEASRVTAETARAAAEGVLFNSIVDETTAYIKDVPANALPYAKLSKLGGMSYLSKNILGITNVDETTINGVTYSINNGVITINGVATQDIYLTIPLLANVNNNQVSMCYFNNKINDKIYFYNKNNNNESVYQLQATLDLINKTLALPRDLSGNNNISYMAIRITNGAIIDNVIVKPMLVNGVSTPTTYEPYWAGFYDAKVTSVGALTIPAAIRALNGYGKGIDATTYNYIDLEIKKFIKAVNNLDIIQSLNIDIYQDNTNTIAFRINNALEANWYLRKAICNKFNRLVTVIDDIEGFTHGDNTSTLFIRINHNKLISYGYSTSATNAVKIQAFKSWLVDNPTTIIYELSTPVATDISEHLAHKYLAANGSVTFNNEKQKAVPSKITFYKTV